MGSLVGSILQTAGQTGNEVATGDIAAQNQSHQFMMDYLANQNRNRQLDIESAGQKSVQSLGQGELDLRKQQLEQSRWNLLPGYQKIADPEKVGGVLYSHTFADPITGQTKSFNSPDPPPGSPEFNMQSFQFMRGKAKELGIDLPINTMLNMAGMKVDSPADVGNKYMTYWSQLQDAAKSDPVAKAALDKNYPGGYVDFFKKEIEGEHPGFSKQEWIDYVRSEGLTSSGNNKTVGGPDKLYEDSLVQTQKVAEAQLANATKTIAGMGAMGRMFSPDAYANAVSMRDNATAKLAETQDKLDQFRSRGSAVNSPVQTPTAPPSGTVTNPGIDQGTAVKLGATHLVEISGQYFWAKADGTNVGPASAADYQAAAQAAAQSRGGR